MTDKHDLPPSGIAPEKVAPNSGYHWLARPETIRNIWIISLIVLVLTVAAEFLVDYKLKFGASDIPAFAAVFGFVACVVLVFGSKALGVLLKREDRYYDD